MGKKVKKCKLQKVKKLEPKKAKNQKLSQAKKAKNDEFYTQISDIERELKHYRHYFKDKVVYCNCDDPDASNFYKYFLCKYKEWGLKKLITTCYRSQQADRRSRNDSDHGICLEYDGDKVVRSYLSGDGDFRSAESIELLKQADIVVTNPPFSLFREYVAQLVEYKKKFLIIGSLNAVTYKEIFKLITEDKLWLGPSIHSGDREFGVPANYPLRAAEYRIDRLGNKYIRVKGIRWFTNIGFEERHEALILYKKYTPEEYPTYANFDAIEVSKTKNIPIDYDGLMGVPISFLDKYNPKQFEIVGASRCLGRPMSEVASKGAYVAGGRAFYLANGNGTYRRLYARFVIRRQQV